MTNAAAENLAGRAGEAHKVGDALKDKDKEKVEKRRALGRGLESLLPGPRVVASVAPSQGGGATGQQQVLHRPSPVRNDNTNSNDKPVRNDDITLSHGLSHRAASDGSAGEVFTGIIQAVAEAEVESKSPPSREEREKGGAPAPHNPSDVAEGESITIFAQAESRIPANLVANLEIADIDKNPFQTRYVEDNDALEELADSIRANGVVQPILVRPSEEEGRYILVLGERRLHASKKAGKTTIPAMVRRVSLQQAAEMTIIENLQRENLSALEQAEAFRILSNEFSLTQQQIGDRVGLSRESVANYMRLLKLPREVMQLLAEKKISFGEAKELLKLDNNDQISKAALYAVKKGMTLEQIEKLVMQMSGLLDPFPGMPGEVIKKASGARWVDPNVRAAQIDLERMLGVRVRIRDRKGKGKIVIEYHTVDDYERVVEMLRGKK
jgi:ParB family chromosome partitioning protein